MKITYFGTGAAMNKSVDTMHMKLFDETNALYIDTGGGMSLMQRILNGQEVINHLYITHCHTDHLLGIAHVLRVMKKKQVKIYCTKDLEKRTSSLMDIVGKGKFYADQKANGNIAIHYISQGNNIAIGDWIISPINLFSSKDEQHGFMLTYEDKKLVFFGDEAVNILNRKDLDQYVGIDRLLCEAFCTDQDKELKNPYNIQHITAKDAGTIASSLQAKHLIISHIDDYTENRKEQLRHIQQDASSTFSGPIIVPHDNDTIDLW